MINAIINRIMNENLNDFLQVKKTDVNSQAFDLVTYVLGKANLNVAIHGGARLGKTTLGEFLCLKLPDRKIVISFKKFLPTRRDFDIGYHWIDVTQHLPNLFADKQSFTEAFRTAFFADLSMKGLTIDTILSRIVDVMQDEPKNFEEFYKILDRLAGRGNWEESIRTIIRSKAQLLQRATAGAKLGSIDFSKGNIVLDLGNLPDAESKTFLAEYYLRQINRIEQQEQREEKIRVVIDEAWHLLKYRQQNSIVGTILLEGAYYIRFLCITQNYTHLDEDYRGHFGCIFCFQNTNDKDITAIKGAYPDGLIWEGVGAIEPFTFIDLKYSHEKELVPVWKLNNENLEQAKMEARFCAEPEENFVIEEQKQEVRQEEEKGEETTIGERIRDVLKGDNTALYGYAIGKAVGFPPKEAGLRVKQPLRVLMKDGEVKEWKFQIRNKEIPYYYLANDSREVCHNLMMQEVKKKLGDWNIVFEATHGIQGADFVIEKNGRKLSIECETQLKKDISDLQSRVAKAETIIVVPTNTAKEFYQKLFTCKVVLIPELEEALKN